MNKSKIKGTKFETQLVNYLKSLDYDAIRVALNGAKDVGDVHVRDKGWVFECKSYAKELSEAQIHEFWEQAEVEAKNSGLKDAQPFLVVKRVGKSKVEDAWIIKFCEAWAGEWCGALGRFRLGDVIY